MLMQSSELYSEFYHEMSWSELVIDKIIEKILWFSAEMLWDYRWLNSIGGKGNSCT